MEYSAPEKAFYIGSLIALVLMLGMYFLNTDQNNGFCQNIYYDKEVSCKYIEGFCECGDDKFDPNSLSVGQNIYLPVEIE